MTCAELVHDVEEQTRHIYTLSKLDPPHTEEIVRVLNKYNDRLSAELKIPRRYLKDVETGAAFAMPSEARPGGLLTVEDDTDETPVEIVTVAEANHLYPDWEDNELEGGLTYKRKLVIYDPVNISAPVYPIGFASGDLIRILYVVKPKPMVLENSADDGNVTTVPWEGELPEFSYAIGQMAIFELLLRINAPTARAYYEDARELVQRAFVESRHSSYLPTVANLGTR